MSVLWAFKTVKMRKIWTFLNLFFWQKEDFAGCRKLRKSILSLRVAALSLTGSCTKLKVLGGISVFNIDFGGEIVQKWTLIYCCRENSWIWKWPRVGKINLFPTKISAGDVNSTIRTTRVDERTLGFQNCENQKNLSFLQSLFLTERRFRRLQRA